MRATVVAVLIAGCGGLIVEQDPPSATVSAQTYFDRDVAPLLEAKCSACHQYTYDSIVADPGLTGNFDPNSALIMMQPPTFSWVHDGGVLWSSADQTVIATWLEAEAEARGL
jgi:cytochrome c peroxidase